MAAAVQPIRPEKRSPESVLKFMELMRERFKLAADAESEWRRIGLEDIKFSIGEQWPPDIKADRERKSKPVMVFNRIGQTIKQVTNNQRQNRTSIQVNPAGSGSTKEVADVLQGCVRHIEVQSDAEVADDIAFDYMVRGGKGFERIITEYVDENGDSLDQEIYLEPVENPFSVYTDPRANRRRANHREYRRFVFIVEDVPNEEYKAQYGESALAELRDMSSIGDQYPEWATKESVRVAEYFYIETVEVKGKARTAFMDELYWAKVNGIEILDERKLKEKFIPVLELVGEDLIVDGKRHTAGLVRDAKDPQRNYNYHVSKAVEVVALAPSAPFVGPEGAFTDQKWETANTGDHAYLEHKSVDLNGTPIPPGAIVRLNAEPPIQAIAELVKQADNDIKATTGIYDASLGERGPDESGKAILQRKQQGDNATFNFTDNLARMKRFAGRVLLDKIRVYYDVPRIQRIINPDNTVDHVGIYNSSAEGMEDFDPADHPDFQDIQKVFDIGVGKYDVTVSVGPSYQTKRQEAAATQLELMRNVPIVQQAAPDLVIRNMDIPGADVIADRIKKALPPQLTQDDEQGQIQNLQATAAQLKQHNDLLSAALGEAQKVIDTKQVEQAGKIVIVKMQEATKLAVAQINASKDERQDIADRELSEYELLHNAAHELAMQNDQQRHDAEQAAQAQQAAKEQQQSAQDSALQQTALKTPPNPAGETAE